MDGPGWPELQELATPLLAGMSVGAIVVGLLLYVMGRRLARPCGVICGMLLGLTGAIGLAKAVVTDLPLPVYLVAGALIGGLGAYLLFRVWIGVTLGVILATVGPVISVTLAESQYGEQVSIKVIAQESAAATATAAGEGVAAVRQAAKDGGGRAMGDVFDDLMDRLGAIMHDWWSQVGQAHAIALMIVGGAGALVGVLLGLAFPYHAAALISSLLGTVLTVAGVGGLLTLVNRPLPSWIPAQPAAIATMIGLITVVGTLFQWIIFRRRADK